MLRLLLSQTQIRNWKMLKLKIFHKDHPAEIAVPFGENLGASSSGGNSTRLETLEALRLNQAMLASRLDAQEAANAEFRSFMARQTASTEGIHDALARILRRLGS